MAEELANHAARAQSFGSIAADYNRLRPSPGVESVDWVVPEGIEIAVDVAAGTGLFTRVLKERVPTVYAVEPDDRMRAVLADHSPGVVALKGTGEDIPLPDASVDALFVASAWHWLDPGRALPEIARVLRDGGRLGVLWTSRDRDIDWVRDLDQLTAQPERDAESEARHRARRSGGLSDVPDFDNAATANFGFGRRMPIEDVVEMIATYSAVITSPGRERAELLRTARARLAARFPGAAEIDLPMRSWCWRADRKSR